VGSLITRIAWIHAGHVSARNWKLPLQEKPSLPGHDGSAIASRRLKRDLY